MWEYFCDESYYGLWAVRRVCDKDFNSQQLFHVQSKEEAMALRDTLNRSNSPVNDAVDEISIEALVW